MDPWVQSGGGANVEEHFMVNNGDGTFTVDRDNRATRRVLHAQPPDGSRYWGWDGGHFVDIDNDGDLDLALGHIRDRGPLVIDQHNTVLVNDGTGYYPTRIDLPRVRFFDGFTAVGWLTHLDVNDDGFEDLFLMNTRNDDVDPDALAWTGRYIQVGSTAGCRCPAAAYGSATRRETWVKRQEDTTPERLPNGEPLVNGGARFAKHDVDLDGCVDLVMVRQGASSEHPCADRLPQQREQPVPAGAGSVCERGQVLRLERRAGRRQRRRQGRLRRGGDRRGARPCDPYRRRRRRVRHAGEHDAAEVAPLREVTHDAGPSCQVVAGRCMSRERRGLQRWEPNAPAAEADRKDDRAGEHRRPNGGRVTIRQAHTR